MARADRLLRLRPVALAAAWALVGTAVHAQSAGLAGARPELSYTPVTGIDAPLVPAAPGDRVTPGVRLRTDLTPGTPPGSAPVDRVVVELDRNHVPADGQSPVKVTVRLFGRDGQPLARAGFVTIEHSGGRVLLPQARTDEFGPRVPTEAVLHDKVAVNFVLDEPTRLRYLDPTMALTNAGAVELRQGRVPPGPNLPPAALEDELLDVVRHHGAVAAELHDFDSVAHSSSVHLP